MAAGVCVRPQEQAQGRDVPGGPQGSADGRPQGRGLYRERIGSNVSSGQRCGGGGGDARHELPESSPGVPHRTHLVPQMRLDRVCEVWCPGGWQRPSAGFSAGVGLTGFSVRLGPGPPTPGGEQVLSTNPVSARMVQGPSPSPERVARVRFQAPQRASLVSRPLRREVSGPPRKLSLAQHQ